MAVVPSDSCQSFLNSLTDRAAAGEFLYQPPAGGNLPPSYRGEFWTAKQRAAHSLHEISYRACFKPQLPAFFIEHLTEPGDTVVDPFAGRGTTALEAILRGRRAITSDLNPLSEILLSPRFNPPSLKEVAAALEQIPLAWEGGLPEDLLVFFHPRTLRTLCALRAYWIENHAHLNVAEKWIRMVATNRLTGHSPGFFSVYTLPPNQAVSIKSQLRINERRRQSPPPRDVPALILRKSQALLRNSTLLSPPAHANEARVVCASADQLDHIEDHSIDLIVTSPPFLDVVDYAGDNWLRGWFNGIEVEDTPLWVTRKIDDWETLMERAMREARRVLKPGKCLAFEVGEVRKGSVHLEENVIQTGLRAGLQPVAVFVHDQNFTKTAHCWGVNNQTRGTNTHRIVLFQKP